MTHTTINYSSPSTSTPRFQTITDQLFINLSTSIGNFRTKAASESPPAPEEACTFIAPAFRFEDSLTAPRPPIK